MREEIPSVVIKSTDNESLSEIIAGMEKRHPKLKKSIPELTPPPIARKIMRGAEIADFVHHKKLGDDY